MMTRRAWKKKRTTVMDTAAKQLQENTERLEEISRMYYKEVQALRKNEEKQYILQFIRLLEEKKEDIRKGLVRMRQESLFSQDVSLIKSWKMDVNELTTILEDHDVEIINAEPMSEYDMTLMKPLKAVETRCKEKHNKIAKVYTSAYRWKDLVLKKMMVDVYIYQE